MSIRRVASELKAHLVALGDRIGMRDNAGRFLRGESGAIAIYFGLSCLVFIGVAGLAVDAARGFLVKARLSQAIDAAALAGGKALQTASDPDNNKVKSDALAFFNANFPNGAMGATVAAPAINITNNNTIVTVSSSAVIPTTLMRVLGFQNMTMASAATVARAQGGLDVVFSFDVSTSMRMPASKFTALKSNATALVDSLYKPFITGGQSQVVTVNGTQYSLLNIGVVPWNAKVNVRTYPATTTGAVTGPTGGTFTDPRGGGGTLPGTFKAANSEVPLLLSPSTLPGGWSGCVYARYTDNSNEADDADTTLGLATGNWKGWEPIANAEGQEGGNNFGDCYAAYWNDNPRKNAPSGNFGATKAPPVYWPTLAGSLDHDEECSQCSTIGILPLPATPAAATNPNTVKNMINALVSEGNTDAPQGLFWAWEVLMPGDPFNTAVVNPPFQRAQAIVFMTDGQNYGGNGDAYHGWFGANENAGTTTSKGNITLPDGTTPKNNLDNHLLQLAQKIKGANPAANSAVKIYVIQYQENNPDLTTLLKAVATEDKAPYYFFAPNSAALGDVFDQIAKSLSALRIVE